MSPDGGSGSPSLRTHLGRVVADLHPAAFALVMATGILAIACDRMGLGVACEVVATINLVAYPALWGVLLVRAALAPGRLVQDLRSHERAPGFFTLVAATAVFGSQALLLDGNAGLARVAWWFAVLLWALVTYGVFTALTVRRHKPSLADGINGGWLVAVVATQSLCVLGALVGDLGFGQPDLAYFLLLSFWLCGGMLYLWIIGMIFQRYMFHEFSPRDLMPPYWVNMGAVAISTLAGVLLVERGEGLALATALRPFLLGLTVMYWATATWWIPMLVVLGVWRHVVRRVRIAYDPLFWGLVFPLGMYATCTFRLAGLIEAPFLLWIARLFLVAAVCAWLLAFLGLAGRLLHLVLLALRSPVWRRLEASPVTPVVSPGGSRS